MAADSIFILAIVTTSLLTVLGLLNLQLSLDWVREEIDREFFGKRRSTPWWVRPFWGRWIRENIDGERKALDSHFADY